MNWGWLRIILTAATLPGKRSLWALFDDACGKLPRPCIFMQAIDIKRLSVIRVAVLGGILG
jgi:hypothetical protein